MRLALCVTAGQHVLEVVAYGSLPVHAHDWIESRGDGCPRWPARRLPANNQLLRPGAMGRIWFSIQLVCPPAVAGRRRRSRELGPSFETVVQGLGVAGLPATCWRCVCARRTPC